LAYLERWQGLNLDFSPRHFDGSHKNKRGESNVGAILRKLVAISIGIFNRFGDRMVGLGEQAQRGFR
jgi:hypothetical protein